MEAARHLVEQQGAAGLSMRALAASVGISAVTAYAIFGSKAGILRAIVEEDRARFAVMMDRAGVGHGIDSIFRLLTLACDLYRDKESFYRAVFQQYFSAGGVEIREILDPGRHRLWHGIVSGMADEGLFAIPVDPHLLTSQLENIFLAAHMRWCLRGTGVDLLEQEIGLGFAMLVKAIAIPEHQAYLGSLIERFGDRLLASAAALPVEGPGPPAGQG